MGKGEQTRAMILAQVAPLFNQQGYAGSSLSDIMRQTGLEKGGIYNHFQSKEQLALQAFDYSFALLDQRIRAVLADKRHALERLSALLIYFQDLADDPPIPGGCPILNTAIESDDAEPALRDRARTAMDQLRSTFRRIISKGIERGELRPGIDVETWTSTMIAALEGAVMLSRLYQDTSHMSRTVAYLRHCIERDLA
ncbi:TetR/AcrR family transcriptional regulator [Dictyobacter aurantiacus]|uniref:TetR family transcriptional regulator n=1 Tax=Dictyobacter aurantiacus TaxID=1936993 RepID=A0A401ZJC7_9CHLR|nr:TetR/AcrR family transcriptional regulator [Dictyobacter aurantiacus]GCE06942.1 TetR family transcriptional regulator [Dictyobacter aurantiacus]